MTCVEVNLGQSVCRSFLLPRFIVGEVASQWREEEKPKTIRALTRTVCTVQEWCVRNRNASSSSIADAWSLSLSGA